MGRPLVSRGTCEALGTSGREGGCGCAWVWVDVGLGVCGFGCVWVSMGVYVCVSVCVCVYGDAGGMYLFLSIFNAQCAYVHVCIYARVLSVRLFCVYVTW